MATSSRTSATYTSTAADVSTPPITASFKRPNTSILCEANHCQAICRNDGGFKRPLALWSLPQACQGCYFVLSQLRWALDGDCRRDLRAWTAKKASNKRMGMGPVVGLEWCAESDGFITCEESVPKGPQRPEGQRKRQVCGPRSRWWCALLSLDAAITLCGERSICSINYITSMDYGETARSAVCESGADPSSTQSVSRSVRASVRIEGHSGQDGKLRNEEDHNGPSQVHSCPWKGSQATARAAGSQGPASGEVGPTSECLPGCLAEANRRFRQAAGAVQHNDPTSYDRIACCQELHPAAQCQGLESLLEEAPAEHPDAALVDAEEKKLRERMKDVLSKAAKAALPATEVVDLVGSGSPVQVQKRPRSTEPAGGTDTAMQGGGT